MSGAPWKPKWTRNPDKKAIYNKSDNQNQKMEKMKKMMMKMLKRKSNASKARVAWKMWHTKERKSAFKRPWVFAFLQKKAKKTKKGQCQWLLLTRPVGYLARCKRANALVKSSSWKIGRVRTICIRHYFHFCLTLSRSIWNWRLQPNRTSRCTCCPI